MSQELAQQIMRLQSALQSGQLPPHQVQQVSQQVQLLRAQYQQQQQQLARGPPPGTPQAPMPQQQQQQQQPQMEKIALSDGNEGLRGANKATDRALPTFKEDESLISLAQSYARMQEEERRVDWNLQRRRLELTEGLSSNRYNPVRRTLRVHVESKPVNQPGQQQADDKVDFTSGEGVPALEITISGELVDGTQDDPKTPFTGYLKRVVVESNRDMGLHDGASTYDWHRGSSAPSHGLTIKVPTTSTTAFRISVYLDHRPERFQIAPDLGSLLDVYEADRFGITHALWAYVRTHGLQEDSSSGGDARQVRLDARLRKIFSNQERVPFHHIPEYVNRFVIPLPPQTVEMSAPHDGTAHSAWDLSIYLDDPVKKAIETVIHNPTLTADVSREIAVLDEQIAADAAAARASDARKVFLSRFAKDPVDFLKTYLDSQASDLETIISGGTAARGAELSGSWREEMRDSRLWNGAWAKESAELWTQRGQEARLRQR